MNRGANTLFNLITLIFLALSALVGLVTVGWTSGSLDVPDSIAPATEFPAPTAVVRQFWTPSFTPLPTDTRVPTDTPTITPTRTASPTQTATATDTDLPTVTASVTSTVTPSSTATQTATFTPTDTPTITLTPTATGFTFTPTNTAAPFPFEVREITIRADLNAACDFQGFAGNVFDLVGEPVSGLTINVTGPGLPQTGAVGASNSNQNYGPGGWEVQVSPFLSTNEYVVQLIGPGGVPFSNPITHRFSGRCTENLLLISYRQIRPY